MKTFIMVTLIVLILSIAITSQTIDMKYNYTTKIVAQLNHGYDMRIANDKGVMDRTLKIEAHEFVQICAHDGSSWYKVWYKQYTGYIFVTQLDISIENIRIKVEQEKIIDNNSKKISNDLDEYTKRKDGVNNKTKK